MCDNATNLLLSWYDAHKRELPWRDVSDPYQTWVSEIMLQQTRVETVMRYFPRFIAAFPDVHALAAAPLDAVLKLWEGLGYYSRARNLHRGAQEIVEQFGGALPSDPALLRKISGVGEYTAGAIASIAYGVRTPAVDGNVIRVISRLQGLRENVRIPSVRRAIVKAAGELVPADRPGDFNQAMMDLGATVCVPGTPDCALCPLQSLCNAFAEGDADELPVLPVRTPPKELYYDVLIVRSGNRVLMRRRTETMLHGLWVYPMLPEWRDANSLAAAAQKEMRLPLESVRYLGEAKHVFTHQVWLMHLYAADVPDAAAAPRGMQFISLDEMRALTIPTAVAAAKREAEKLLT